MMNVSVKESASYQEPRSAFPVRYSSVQSVTKVTVYGHNQGPCFRCLYPTTPVTPDSEKYGGKLPILSPLPGVVGSMEVDNIIRIENRRLKY